MTRQRGTQLGRQQRLIKCERRGGRESGSVVVTGIGCGTQAVDRGCDGSAAHGAPLPSQAGTRDDDRDQSVINGQRQQQSLFRSEPSCHFGKADRRGPAQIAILGKALVKISAGSRILNIQRCYGRVESRHFRR